MQKLICLVAVLLFPAQVFAGHLLVPDDPKLEPGDLFHLAFVSEARRDAFLSDIRDYNAFVNQEADRPGSLTKDFGIDWSAIISTPDVAASANTLVSGPVYRLDGKKVATNFDDFWDGTLMDAISLDQFGQQHVGGAIDGGIVWTGSTTDGKPFPEEEVGSPGATARVGLTDFLDRWVSSGRARKEELLRLYAVSEPLFVPIPATGDFNEDHAVDAADLNLLGTEIAAGTNQKLFDLDGDALVNRSDLHLLLGGNLLDGGNKLNGDANFDGVVDFADFLTLSFNFGLKNRTWSEGDFDSDGDIEFPDFLVLSNNFGKSATNVAAVPEPSGSVLMALGLAVLGVARARRVLVIGGNLARNCGPAHDDEADISWASGVMQN